MFNRRRSRRQPTQQELFEAKVAGFLSEVDTRVRVFELDPELPEIAELKASAREILEDGLRCGIPGISNLYLSWLNPYKDVVYSGMHLTIFERMFGHVLRAHSLVEFHLRKTTLERVCQRIRVDGSGTRIFDSQGTEYVHYLAGILNPHRAADPGNRVDNAVTFINHFTGLTLTQDELWPLYWAEFSLVEDVWQAEYGRERVTST